MTIGNKSFTTDTTQNNPTSFLYIIGNEFTDGSVRFSIDDAEQIGQIEKRILGVWQPSSFKTGANSVFVGTLVRLSAAGSNLITTDADNNINFHVRSSFENGVTIGLSKIINSLAFFERVIFRSDESGAFTGTVIETVDLNITAHLITGSFYFKTNATAATAPVRIQSWQGSDDTGLLIFDQTYPSSSFPANTEIKLPVIK